ncbi:MAG: PqqD family protein [Deltaproteobacteria bacterium]|nr:PqqD family protein [Deltaproteobacteria bacterium]
MDLDKVYTKSDSIVSRKIADEVILVPIRQDVGDLESIYTLNEVAARIWELVDGKTTVNEIKDIVVNEYEVPPIEVEKDIVGCLGELESVKAVTEG